MGHFMTFLWQNPSWPSFYWTHGSFLNALVKARHNQGRLLALGQNFVHSFEMIEQRKSIFSDWFVPGLSEERLLGWQASLFPTGFAGIKRVKVGAYRTKDINRMLMPAAQLPQETARFLQWWSEAPADLDPAIKSAIACFWFLVLSPFEAGNQTLAAALGEKVLIENEDLTFRTYDLALQIEENEARIQELLAETAQGDGDLTNWISFYIDTVNVAVESALAVSEQKNDSQNFWQQLAKFDLNFRQRKILALMFEEKGTMTNRRYVEICKTSRESAKRDLTALLKLQILKSSSTKGRSVFYQLA